MADKRARAAGRARRLALFVLAALALTAAAIWALAATARNADWREPDPASEPAIALMIGTNGVHTEIVMPHLAAGHDWRAVFPLIDIQDPYRGYTHVAVSFGERAFFLETPTWSDLDPLTAISALIGGEGILHIAHYVRPAPSNDYRVMFVRPGEYQALVHAITGELQTDYRRARMAGYDDYDVFYPVQTRYHLGRTCNQWTSNKLAAAGIKTGWLTPFSGGVMQWIEPKRKPRKTP